MKIDELREYRKYAERLDCIEGQLEHHEVHDAVLGDSGEPAHEQVTKPVEGYIHGIGTVSLLTEKKRCERAMECIELYILAIPEERIRKALLLYCKNKTTWEKVANEIGEDNGDTLQRAVSRALYAIEQNEQKAE